MFGPQGSSLSRTGTTLLLLMVALFSVQLTCNTTLASDDFQEKLPKNHTSSLNLTDHKQSMLRNSLVTPSVRKLGFTMPNWVPTGLPDVPDWFTKFDFAITGKDKCWMGQPEELKQCVDERKPSMNEEPEKVSCQGTAAVVSCQIEAACAYCADEELKKVKKEFKGEIKDLNKICANYPSMVPSLSCTNWTLITIIIVVVVLVLALVVGVIVCCCCCCTGDGGGKGKRGRGGVSGRSRGKSFKSRKSKSSKSKSKSKKGSYKKSASTRG